jgi:hypothetical protein
MRRDPNILTTATNRNLLQPTRDHKSRRRSELQEHIRKGKNRSTSPSEGSSQQGVIEAKLKRHQERSPSASGKSDRSQLVDLVVEDTDAEEAEIVRARKEGGDSWNRAPQRHYVRTYDIDEEAPEAQDIREGYDPSKVPSRPPAPERAVSEDEDNVLDERDRGRSLDQNGTERGEGQYANLIEEDNVWK